MSSSNSNTIKAQAYFQSEIGRSPLVNKLGITAQQELEAVEAFYVEHAIVNGLSKKAQSLFASLQLFDARIFRKQLHLLDGFSVKPLQPFWLR